MKDMKITTKLLTGFIIIDVLVILSIFIGYSTAQKIIGVDNPEHYLQSYGIFIVVEVIVALLVMGCISLTITRTLRNSLKQVIDVTQEIADGKVDVTLNKHADDEFGELIDEYQSVIENIRYHATIAE